MCISDLFIVELLVTDTTREHRRLLFEVVELAPEIFLSDTSILIYKVPVQFENCNILTSEKSSQWS